MRFLFDENLSEALVQRLSHVAPGSLHVRTLDEGGATDERVWRLAIELGCTIITRDEDFVRLSVLRGAPPKVVVVRLANCSTGDVSHLLRDRADVIERFLTDVDATFLALG